MAYFAITPCDPSVLRPVFAGYMAETVGDERWLALVDTAFDHEGKSLKMAGGDGFPVYHQGRLQTLLSVSPTLFELAQSAPDLLDQQLSRLLHHCCGRPMLGFIRSALSAGALRERWQYLLEVETEDNQSYLLRFADTRVLPALAGQMEIWNRLAADVTAWWIIGRDGAPMAIDMSHTPEHDDSRLLISNDSLPALLEAGAVDAMVEYMYRYFPNLLATRNGAANYRLLAQINAVTTAHQIGGMASQYALGVATLLTDGRLLTHPAFEDWLAERTWQAKGMEDALAEFMEDKDIS